MKYPFEKITNSTIRYAAAIALTGVIAFLALAPAGRAAGSLSTAVPGMFPKDVGEFAYADLKAARQLPWFSDLREQILPSRFRDFEKFLASAGIDPNTQVDELAWASMAATSKDAGEQVVGVALGSFNPSSSEEIFKQQKLPMFDVHGYHTYAFGSGSGSDDLFFTFIDSNTAAFGHRAALQKLIDVRTGASDSLLRNDQLFPLINEMNGTGVIWAVLDQSHTQLGIKQLLPEMGQFPQAGTMIQRLKSMTISVDTSNGVDARFQTVCASTDDANLLGAALQAGILYKRYQDAQSPSQADLGVALDQVRVVPSGDRLKIDIPISQDQIVKLIKSKAFATTM
jgi:hypothetical protein